MQIDRIFTVLDKPKHEQAALARTRELIAHRGPAKPRRPDQVAAFCWQPLAEAAKTVGAADAKALKRNLIDERKHWLAEMLAEQGADNLASKTIWTPQIADWISSNLTPDRFDLVVKSIHRHPHLEPSETDWELLNGCPVPLLLTANPPVKRRRNVLAAIDLQKLDRKHQALNFQVLDAAATLARLTDSELHVACAVEYSQVLRDLDVIDPDTLQRRLKKDSAPLLASLCAPYEVATEHRHFPLGKAGMALNQTAKTIKAGTIVMGSFPHPGKALFGVGNTASRIIRKANCDVLIVPT
ncbi:MAG: universal stress protein [Pseudomonadota bacterium]